MPVAKGLRDRLDNPAVPASFGKNQRGMVSGEEIPPVDQEKALKIWHKLREISLQGSMALNGDIDSISDEDLAARYEELDIKYGSLFDPTSVPVHKEVANRPTEPYMMHTVLITATDWENFHALRSHEDAQLEIEIFSNKIREAIEASEPRLLLEGEWHTPFIQESEQNLEEERKVKVSVGRCARLSYLTHLGVRDLSADISLHDNLVGDGHMSPAEHVARPLSSEEWEEIFEIEAAIASIKATERRAQIVEGLKRDGNFRGYRQYRKTLPFEDNYKLALENLA